MATILPKETFILEYLIINTDVKKVRTITKYFGKLINDLRFIKEKT